MITDNMIEIKNKETQNQNKMESNSKLREGLESSHMPITPSKKENSDLYIRLESTEIKVKNLKRTFATSPHSFAILVEKDVFIDKSLFIKDVIEDDSEHILITRPRRWGKTLNMDMLKTFFEIEIDKSRKKKFAQNKRLNPKLFNNLKIKQGNFIDTCKLCKILLNYKTTQTFDDLHDQYKIEILIETLEFTKNNEWLEIKEEVLLIKNPKISFDEYPTELKNLARNYYGEILTDICDEVIMKAINKIENNKILMNKSNYKKEAILNEKLSNIEMEKKQKDLEDVSQQIQFLKAQNETTFVDLMKDVENKLTNWKNSRSPDLEKKYRLIDSGYGLVERYMGKYPVIFITFNKVPLKTDYLNNDYIFMRIKDAITEAYKSHRYLTIYLDDMSRNGENYMDKEYAKENLYFYNRMCNENDDDNLKVSMAELENSILNLSRLLHEYYGREVYIIIDEYDAPLNSCFGEDYYKDVLVIIEQIFKNGMKNNKHVKKAIMTGILRIAKADFFSGLNNFKEYGILDDEYAEFFRFTEEEVNKLLDENLENVPPLEKKKQQGEIKKFYNGYEIGKFTIYNPWSIMH